MSFKNTLRALKDARTRNRTYRTTYNELAAMSDRELSDIGLARGQIGSIAYTAAYGEN